MLLEKCYISHFLPSIDFGRTQFIVPLVVCLAVKKNSIFLPMKRISSSTWYFVFAIMICLSALNSCVMVQSTFKSNYIESYTFESNLTIEETWKKVIQWSQDQGLPIAFINEENGIINSASISFLNKYTYESQSGKLFNPNAQVVVSKTVSSGTECSAPTVFTGNWSVFVQEVGDCCKVKIALINLSVLANMHDSSSPNSPHSSPISLVAKSTGLFEHTIDPYFDVNTIAN
jgi:hypothetical protein